MKRVIYIDSDELSQPIAERFLTQRGHQVRVLSAFHPGERFDAHSVVIIDGTRDDEIDFRFIENIARCHPSNVLLAIMAGARERFELKRFIGDSCETVSEGDGKRELLEACDTEIDNAEITIEQHSPSLVKQLFHRLLSTLCSWWNQELRNSMA